MRTIESAFDVTELPYYVLETILFFNLHSCKSIATFSQVCKSWYLELKHNLSPELWKFLLKKYQWPVPDYSFKSYIENRPNSIYKRAFLTHYSKVCNLKSFKHGTEYLQSTTSSYHKNVVLKHLRLEKGSIESLLNQRSIECLSLKIYKNFWIISAYRDCSIRLHHIKILKNERNASQYEIYETSSIFLRKIHSTMEIVNMEVAEDSDFIVCLSNERGAGQVKVIASINIEKVQLQSSTRIFVNEEDIVTYHSLTESVCEHVKKNYSLSATSIKISNELASCGKDTFLFESLIEFGEENDNKRFLCLFSLTYETIIYSVILEYPSYCPFLRFAAQEEISRNDRSKRNDDYDRIILLYSEMIVDPFVVYVKNGKALNILNDQFCFESYNRNMYRNIARKVIVLSSDVIVADSYENLWRGHMQFLPLLNIYSFSDLNKSIEEKRITSLSLSKKNRKIFDICAVKNEFDCHDEYFIVYLQSFFYESMIAILIHLPSRTEIAQVDFGSNLSNISHFHCSYSNDVHAHCITSHGESCLIVGGKILKEYQVKVVDNEEEVGEE